MKRYFITGTDTDCGKTYVSAKLLTYFPDSAAIKPIASGGDADAQILQQHNKRKLSLDIINPWRFQLPIAPHIAAERASVQLSARELTEYCLNLDLPDIDKLFIEGAGGLLVPLNQNETWVDFLLLSQIPVIVIVGMKLGCINHALLTETALRANGIRTIGWIANCLPPQMQFLEENINTLKSKLKMRFLGVVS